MNGREQEVLETIELRRRRKPRLTDELITLAHGAGGKSSHVLVEALFLGEFGNPLLAPLADAAVFTQGGTRLALTTDSYVVKPLFFPGGDIGELAVNGTVNDLAMMGARPLYLTAGFIIEEGFPTAELRKIATSMGAAARTAEVAIIAGDTKVVERDKGDGVYINTAGVGVLERELELSPSLVRPGDKILVSGTLGDHGMAVMVARGNLELEVDLESDTAALADLVRGLLEATDGVRCLRDLTRGGLATVLNEIALTADVGIVIDESSLPVRPEVNGACEILGIDPLYVANEGKLMAVVAPEAAEAAFTALASHELGINTEVVGQITEEQPGLVVLETTFGGRRVVEMLVGDPLPRIC
ncbi:MAG: hydrogenase expression/formation protein HypE [Actinobacteria bacterium]|nr:hydrogenase expression/formation protein HypE [Actinomycetota bacterium]